jgi:hypothetical protein
VVIDQIDKTAPSVLLLAYDPMTLTNSAVTATLITDKLIHRPVSRSGDTIGKVFTKTYTDNISTIVVFTDLVGNQNYTGIDITRIDKGDLTASLTYTPSTLTSGDVEASISFNKTGVIILNNSGSAVHLFTDNDDFTFDYQALNGTTGATTATVTWIDRTAPQVQNIAYSPNTSTSAPVLVTITLDESGTMSGWISLTPTTFIKFYTTNTTETAIFTDLAGNTNSTPITVNRIVPPSGGG